MIGWNPTAQILYLGKGGGVGFCLILLKLSTVYYWTRITKQGKVNPELLLIDLTKKQRKINADLGHICKWFRANKLILNVKKSNFLLIGCSFRLSKVGSIHISADNVPLDNVESYTYLVIVINNRFSWSDYIDYICGMISKTLGLLRCIKSCLPLKARITFFNSFILPLFDYGDIIWGDRGKCLLDVGVTSITK